MHLGHSCSLFAYGFWHYVLHCAIVSIFLRWEMSYDYDLLRCEDQLDGMCRTYIHVII